jgi:hypothetical protein
MSKTAGAMIAPEELPDPRQIRNISGRAAKAMLTAPQNTITVLSTRHLPGKGQPKGFH